MTVGSFLPVAPSTTWSAASKTSVGRPTTQAKSFYGQKPGAGRFMLTYVLAGVERDARRMHKGLLLPPGGALAKKPHVYKLAAEFGVESKAIMDKLKLKF
jgi:hypothetical protein